MSSGTTGMGVKYPIRVPFGIWDSCAPSFNNRIGAVPCLLNLVMQSGSRDPRWRPLLHPPIIPVARLVNKGSMSSKHPRVSAAWSGCKVTSWARKTGQAAPRAVSAPCLMLKGTALTRWSLRKTILCLAKSRTAPVLIKKLTPRMAMGPLVSRTKKP